MLQVQNEGPFQAALTLFSDLEGVDTVFLVAKATFALGESIQVASEQVPLIASDVHWGAPGHSGLRYAAELHLTKPSTDVALVGCAHSPGGRDVDQLEASIEVGPVAKSLRVLGDRDRAQGSPRPFSSMPLTWERAYGGRQAPKEGADGFRAVEANPVGRGFGDGSKAEAPNVLDPKDSKQPAGFGFIAAAWSPRVGYAGTYDDAWQKQRAPYLPLDFDPRYFNAAHPDLVCPAYLRGGEPVRLENVSSRAPVLAFDVPTVSLAVTASVAGRQERMTPNLETLLFEPDEDRMTMLFRAALRCDKEALKVKSIRVELDELVLNGCRA